MSKSIAESDKSGLLTKTPASPLKIGVYQNIPPGEAEHLFPDRHFLMFNLSRGDRYVQKRGGHLVEGIKPAGEVVLSPAGEDSYWRWNWTKTILDILVDASFIKNVGIESGLKERMIELRSCFGRTDDYLLQTARNLYRETQRPGIGGRLLIESLTNQLAVHLLRNYAVWQPLEARSYGLSPPVLQRVIELMRERLTKSVSLAELAAAANLSAYHFTRQFRKATGFPPYRYFTILRLEKAKELIQTGNISLAEVALSLGFSDQPHLTRHFRRHFGVSPGEISKK